MRKWRRICWGVADSIDHAIALAKKNHYSLHIVTLEGEYLSPGGSMTGGAFKNSSNLLARRREVEELETKTNRLLQEIAQIKNRREDLLTAIELNEEELEQVKETLQKEFIRQNTAKINVDRAMQQKNESEEVFSSLMKERQQMDRQVEEIRADQTGIKEELEHSRQRETEIQHANEAFQKMLEEQKELENKAESELSGIQLEEANIRQKVEFAQTNMERINGDLEKFETEKTGLLENAKNFKEDVEKKQHDIAEIQKTILASSDSHGELEQKLRESVEQKEQMSAEYRGFFRKQEEISERCNGLDKEVFRLNNQREKLNESAEQQTNYLWEEYELTPHAAAELRNSEYEDPLALKKLIAAVKDEIRKLGTVNVNAIEEYKEVSERYTFLKGQHDDLVEAEQTLLGIIEDLDSGMRKQFLEKFAEIQKEFNASFKHLFGGGHGALELVEDEDILECGIRIIAQPPGKKLQNMMQMSGGEKALTAIALLFAIQALKPSPFCLLDEIEAALDDSNVSRFASYLNKLTKNTQFIVITHRRGTMTAADRLYGITMQEKGVSTLVSVDLIEHDLN
jgi:chromosome segregation protein